MGVVLSKQFPSIITQEWRNLRVVITRSFQLPGIITWKLRNLHVTMPTDFSPTQKLLRKNTIFLNISAKTKKNSKIF